jgi:hypothetical protein
MYGLGDYTNGKLTSPSKIADWVIKVSKSTLPKRDPLIIDNEMKFLGGYHPQYSAYPCPPK